MSCTVFHLFITFVSEGRPKSQESIYKIYMYTLCNFIYLYTLIYISVFPMYACE